MMIFYFIVTLCGCHLKILYRLLLLLMLFVLTSSFTILDTIKEIAEDVSLFISYDMNKDFYLFSR